MTRVLAPPVPALVVGTVSHTRRRPLHHAFTHRQFQWLVDVDELPALRWPTRWLARFEASDHLDGARRGGGLRADLESFLARHGVRLDSGDRVLMLAHARVVGHVFDPLTVFWCRSCPTTSCAPSSSRCTTPTASATATCSTRRAGLGPHRQDVLRLPVPRRRRHLRRGARGHVGACGHRAAAPTRPDRVLTVTSTGTPARGYAPPALVRPRHASFEHPPGLPH